MSTMQSAHTLPLGRGGSRLCLRLSAGDPVVIEAWGQLCADTGHLLLELVEHVLRDGPATVVLDLSHARRLSADGTRVLWLAEAMIVAGGARVELAGTGTRTIGTGTQTAEGGTQNGAS